MSEIRVGRVYHDIKGFNNIRADRKTVFGNPFFMRDESHRDSVCESFKAYLDSELKKNQSPLKDAMNDLVSLLVCGESIQLQCWCYPKRCHCDSIKERLEKRVKFLNKNRKG